MKYRSGYLKFLWFISLLLCTSRNAISEEKPATIQPPETRMTITYLYNSKDTVTLTAAIMIKRDSGPKFLSNAMIGFFAAGDLETLKIGSIKTDEEGTAVLKYPVKKGIPHDKEGITVYSAVFNGIGSYAATSEKVTAKFATISIQFNSKDSLRNIDIHAFEAAGSGEENPIKKQTVILYVPRLFSLLKIGEVVLDDDGKGSLEFPRHLIGDSLGIVKVIGQIEDNDLYGTVQAENNVNWGIPKHFFTAERPSRELWTPIAPVWMIITLIIMLAGVWAHYMYAVFQLFLIRYNRKGKNM